MTLVDGGYVINGATLSSLYVIKQYYFEDNIAKLLLLSSCHSRLLGSAYCCAFMRYIPCYYTKENPNKLLNAEKPTEEVLLHVFNTAFLAYLLGKIYGAQWQECLQTTNKQRYINKGP